MATCLNPGLYGPCRKCGPCKERKQREWVLRMLLEAMLYDDDQVSFLTLTYSNENLPSTDAEAKRQLQLWLKRARKLFGVGSIRFVAALEKGQQATKRYHWHVVLYGVRFTEVNRHFILNTWGNGFIDWKPSTPGRMSYTMKYAIKDGCFLMSRKPGIAGGMVKSIQQTIDGLSDFEKSKLVDPKFMLTRVMRPVTHRTIKLNRMKIGGYPYSVPRYLKDKVQLGLQHPALDYCKEVYREWLVDQIK